MRQKLQNLLTPEKFPFHEVHGVLEGMVRDGVGGLYQIVVYVGTM